MYCFLLEHQWMFWPFIIAVFESFSFPQSEKMDLKIISHCWTGAKYAEDAGKPKNLWDLEDFSEEQQAVLTALGCISKNTLSVSRL